MPPTVKSHHRRTDAPHKRSPSERLLAWYDVHRRELPWRAKPGVTADPYFVWLSEIMLQQTTVTAVGPYFRFFTRRWPNLQALAAASQDEILGAWSGLGYYSRARNMHRAAKTIVAEHGGKFPQTAAALRALPGVGPYTAAAIAAIVFGERVAAMDANAERVIARFFAVEEALPKARPQLAALAAPLVPEKRAGDFAQALMDLGSQICTTKRPACTECPLASDCRGYALGIAETLPRKAVKPLRPLKRGAAFVAVDSKGAVYVVRRPEKGLLGAMLQPPLGEWSEKFPSSQKAVEAAPFTGDWSRKPGMVRHVFTHFELEMEVYVAEFRRRPNGEGFWLAREEMKAAALPTVMRKIIDHALDEDAPLLRKIGAGRH